MTHLVVGWWLDVRFVIKLNLLYDSSVVIDDVIGFVGRLHDLQRDEQNIDECAKKHKTNSRKLDESYCWISQVESVDATPAEEDWEEEGSIELLTARPLARNFLVETDCASVVLMTVARQSTDRKARNFNSSCFFRAILCLLRSRVDSRLGAIVLTKPQVRARQVVDAKRYLHKQEGRQKYTWEVCLWKCLHIENIVVYLIKKRYFHWWIIEQPRINRNERLKKLSIREFFFKILFLSQMKIYIL